MVKLFESDLKMMDIIWANEPIPSGKLCNLCSERLGWKKSTTYTMLKKLSQKGVLVNEATIVTSILKRNEVQKNVGDFLVEKAFDGSLLNLVTTYLRDRDISQEDADEIILLLKESAK